MTNTPLELSTFMSELGLCNTVYQKNILAAIERLLVDIESNRFNKWLRVQQSDPYLEYMLSVLTEKGFLKGDCYFWHSRLTKKGRHFLEYFRNGVIWNIVYGVPPTRTIDFTL